MDNEQTTAEWAATAVDTVLDQMEADQRPNAADVLVANVALFAAERDGADWQGHLRTRPPRPSVDVVLDVLPDGEWMCPHHGIGGREGEDCPDCRAHWGLT